MLLLKVPSLVQLAYLSAACIGSYWLYWQLTIGRSRRQLAREHGCKPAKRARALDPILGLDMLFKTSTWSQKHIFLEKWNEWLFADGTRTLAFNSLGSTVIFTAEAENIKAVLSTRFKSFRVSLNPKDINLLLGDGIFTTDGQAWHESRELLRPCFARSQVADLDILETHVRTLIGKIPRDGSTVDLSKLFSQLSMSVIIDFMFGEGGEGASSILDFARHDSFFEVWDRVLEFLAEEGQSIKALILRNTIDRVRTNPQYKRDCRMINDYVDDLVEKSLSAKHPSPTTTTTTTTPNRYLFVRELVTQTTNRTKIRSEALGILLAGRETTAAVLSNVFFQLGRRPDVFARLQEEIHTHLAASPTTPPTYDQLKNLKYVRAILNEAQRLWPIVPLNERRAGEDIVLPLGGGPDEKSPLLVRKGQTVVYGIYSMHRRRDLYGEDADEFRPERWLDEEGEGGKKGLRMGWHYLPFSGGPRVCIGQNFAITEASYVVVRLMQEFGRIENRDPEPWRECITLVCSSLGGCQVGLFPRGEGEGVSEEK